ASFADELIDGRHGFLRGLWFGQGTNRSRDEETSLKLFSGADPINFRCMDDPPLLVNWGGPYCGAANLGGKPDLTSPILEIAVFFTKHRRTPVRAAHFRW
ncbi:MAG TPA: hypothetical protein VLO11_14875, partial [Luteolibacter sp.]|nr:hypothetical protein [Luteolibacter sp.]